MKYKFCITLVFLCIILSMSITSGGCALTGTTVEEAPPSEPPIVEIRDGVRVETHMVEMRDEIHLATDVYFPADNEKPHGSILLRTPYNKDDLSSLGVGWSDPGYPVIIQDTRGRFASEGIDNVFHYADTDGYDTLSWIAEQPFSNGWVATSGWSALGFVQYFMAGANPPHLACQHIQVAAPDLYLYAFQQGGQFREELVENWLGKQGSGHLLDDYLNHEKFSKEFWGNVTMDGKWENVQVPAIHFGGWYDCFAQGTIDGFLGYQYQGGDGAKGNSKLVMGPWAHHNTGEQEIGELTYPENAADNFWRSMYIDMFQQYTMFRNDHFRHWPAVTYYVMGDVDDSTAPGNQWLVADDWPVTHEPVSLYMGTFNSLDFETYEPSVYTYDYDPLDPVPTVGGQNLFIEKGPYDQSSVEQRNDVIVFTTDVLSEPVWITGPVTARLFVSSDQVDTDFTVKLTDVYPDGRSMLITDGILRMRNRNSLENWDFMEPGEIYEIEIDLWSTAYIFNEGHQIRVSVSSSNAPRFLPNPNTADGYKKNLTVNVAENTLYVGSEHPSRLILPVPLLDFETEVKRASEVLSQAIERFKEEYAE